MLVSGFRFDMSMVVLFLGVFGAIRPRCSGHFPGWCSADRTCIPDLRDLRLLLLFLFLLLLLVPVLLPVLCPHPDVWYWYSQYQYRCLCRFLPPLPHCRCHLQTTTLHHHNLPPQIHLKPENISNSSINKKYTAAYMWSFESSSSSDLTRAKRIGPFSVVCLLLADKAELSWAGSVCPSIDAGVIPVSASRHVNRDA